jgi:hypothetical protein
MKKYLMTLAAFALVSSAFISCSNDEGVAYDPTAKKVNDYNAAFVARYGQPAANQDWGFGITRSVDVNSNEWEANGNVIPKDITDREREVVMKWFTDNKNPQSETVDLTNYFVQNVGHGNVSYTCVDGNGASHTAVGSNHMDWIFCGPGRYMYYGMTEPAPYNYNDGDEHINNFNAQSGEIQHILYTGTEYFGYHDSFQDNGRGSKYSTVNRNFVLRFIDVDGEVGCYVGFDYESHGNQGDIEPDGYFNDRVIKIVPGDGSKFIIPGGYTDRVICEDLGTTDDSDFNDVAFDIRYADGGAYFRVVSVGGIYPLYVAGNEVHEMFCAQPKADGTYQILGERTSDEFFVRGATKAADIEVKVTYIDKSGTATAAPASTFTLTADQGKVPQKICVSPKFQLCAERQNIGDKYKNFKKYVGDPTVAWY